MALRNAFNLKGVTLIPQKVFFIRCRIKILLLPVLLNLFSLCCLFSFSYAFIPDKDIASCQKEIADKPIGERIALWAEKFVGTPYDPDPMGEYVTKNVIVADSRVDCMYLSFRAVELAMSFTPDKAIEIALDKRFIGKGKLDHKGNVINYDDRFQYGEDMIDSGKWGREVTSEFGSLTEIKGSRGKNKVKIISKKTMIDCLNGLNCSKLKDGDFVFFIKAVEKRKVGEIVGHIGIIKTEPGEIYLIHASGVKNKGGEVKKVRLYDYINSMPFIGVRVSRFD